MRIEQPGPDTFLQLRDTPDSYSGFGADAVLVKIAEDGLEFGTGGGGASTFIQLTDVPNSYSGQALKSVRVNAGETGLEFITGGGGGTIDTIVAGDNVVVDDSDPANPIVSAYGANVEGGVASSIYLAVQVLNGGFANGGFDPI